MKHAERCDSSNIRFALHNIIGEISLAPQCPARNRYQLMVEKEFLSHNRLRMNLQGHTLNGLEQTSTDTIRQTCLDRIRHGHYIRRCMRLFGVEELT